MPIILEMYVYFVSSSSRVSHESINSIITTTSTTTRTTNIITTTTTTTSIHVTSATYCTRDGVKGIRRFT